MLPQLPVTVYLIVSVPGAAPVTRPPEVTVATAVFVLLHTPPVAVSVKVAVAAGVSTGVPDIVPGDGAALTAMPRTAAAMPQVLLTV